MLGTQNQPPLLLVSFTCNLTCCDCEKLYPYTYRLLVNYIQSCLRITCSIKSKVMSLLWLLSQWHI